MIRKIMNNRANACTAAVPLPASIKNHSRLVFAGIGFILIALFLNVPNVQANETITLNMKEADINALIGTVAEVTGKNFIVDPRVKGKVTVISPQPLNRDELYQVFLSILRVHKYAAVPSGNITKIVPEVDAKQDGVPSGRGAVGAEGDEVVTRVIQLKNISAPQLVPILRPLVPSQGGHLAAYPASNVLIISDRAANIDRVVSIIKRIDQDTDSEIELIPLKHASAAEIVRILGSLEKGSTPGKTPVPNAAGPTIVADERTNSVLLGGDKASRLRLRAIIAHLDTPLDSGGNTKVIYLRYAQAKDLVEVLRGVGTTQQQGKEQKAAPAQKKPFDIQADEAANALVITAAPDVMRSLDSVIRQLDIRRAQVLVEAIIVEISNDKGSEMGIQWRLGSEDLDGSGILGGSSFNLGGDGSTINSVSSNPLGAGTGFSIGYMDGPKISVGDQEFFNFTALAKERRLWSVKTYPLLPGNSLPMQTVQIIHFKP